MAGKGGGAWKVAYADFVTAMMAFFMVMWLVNQKPDAKEAIEAYFQDPWAKSRLNSRASRDPSIMEHRAGQTNPGKEFLGSNPHLAPHDDWESPDSRQPKITTVRASERTAVGTLIRFTNGEQALDAVGKQKLDDLLPRLVGLNYKIEVRGHVSARESYLAGPTTSDWRRCYERSLAVMSYLRDSGIAEGRIRLSQAAGHEPLVLNGHESSDSSSGRVEVFLLNETLDPVQ